MSAAEAIRPSEARERAAHGWAFVVLRQHMLGRSLGSVLMAATGHIAASSGLPAEFEIAGAWGACNLAGIGEAEMAATALKIWRLWASDV